MSVIKEFREFAVKGNVIDLAVGVIIGAAFGKIVDSVVRDLIMPIVGLAFGKLDFSQYFFALGQVPAGTPQTLDAVRQAEALQAAPPPNPEIELLKEIRDALKAGGSSRTPLL